MNTLRSVVESYSRRTNLATQGQHIVGHDYDTEPHVLPLFEAANEDPRMLAMYRFFHQHEKYWSGTTS